MTMGSKACDSCSVGTDPDAAEVVTNMQDTCRFLQFRRAAALGLYPICGVLHPRVKCGTKCWILWGYLSTEGHQMNIFGLDAKKTQKEGGQRTSRRWDGQQLVARWYVSAHVG